MDLLQTLAMKLHCQYLSDLRFSIPQNKLSDAVQELSEGDFNLQEYADAANYILQKSDDYTTIADAKSAILHHLSGE